MPSPPRPTGIKVKTFAVLYDLTRTRHLVWRGADFDQPFHRLLGGHLEFGESTRDGVVREIAEELGTTLLDPVLLGVLESVFEHEGEPGHEIVFVYTGVLEDPEIVGPDGGWFADNDDPIWVEWRPVDDEAVDVPLYPSGLTGLLGSDHDPAGYW